MGVYDVLGWIHFGGTVSFGNILDQFSAYSPNSTFLMTQKRWRDGCMAPTDLYNEKSFSWPTRGLSWRPKMSRDSQGAPTVVQKMSHDSQGVPILVKKYHIHRGSQLTLYMFGFFLSSIKICFCHTVIFSVSIFSGFIILTSLRQKWLDPRLQYTPPE